MDYQVEKTIEYRLEEAMRRQKRVDLVREARGLRRADRPATTTLRSVAERFANWTRRTLEVAADTPATSLREGCVDD